MKEITIQNNTYLFILCKNEDIASDFDIDKAGYTNLYNLKLGQSADILSNKEENFEIVSTTKSITEKEAETIVDKFEQKIGWRLDGDISKLNSIVLFQNYNYKKPVPVTFLLGTAKESLNSLIQSIELDESKNYLILQKL
jgi:predicted nucleic-acid-binding Zn-ribbon protein